MYDASNRKEIRKAEKAAIQLERSRIEFLQISLGSIGGRVWFHGFLEDCHLFSDPFTGEALREAYSKGERNIGLRIFAEILAHCPDQYILMMREATERENARRNSSPGPAAEHGGGEDAGWNVEESGGDT